MSTSTYGANTIDSRYAHVSSNVTIGTSASSNPSKGKPLSLAEF